MIFDMEGFNKIKRIEEENYKKIGDIFCPYLKSPIAFNRKGLEHITMKGWKKSRPVSDQFMRIKFLKWAPIIVGKSHTLQEFQEKRSFERQKINSRWEYRATDTKYYGFVAILKKIRVKIVVKEIVGGKPYFWSVIPF